MAGLCAGAAGDAALPCAALVSGFLAAPVRDGALAAALPAAGFFAAGLATVLLAGAFAALPDGAFFAGAFFTGAFFAATFFAAAFFTGAFFAATLPAAALLLVTPLPAAAFFTAARAAGLAALVDAVFFGVALPAVFAAARAGDLAATLPCPLPPVGFDLSAVLPALFGFLPFCALAAVELALVFAISLHPGWPWGPRVIADAPTTGKPASGILVPLHGARRFGTVNILSRLILWLLALYKRWLSPLLGPRCRFHPSCSDYARIAVTRFGPWRGSLLTAWRLLRCQPLCTGGEDPVPQHFHFVRCGEHPPPADPGAQDSR